MELFKSIVRLHVDKLVPTYNRGRPRKVTFDEAFDGISTLTRTGMQWKYVPVQRSSPVTIFRTFQTWSKHDVFLESYRALLKLYTRKRRPKCYILDSSYVKNNQGADCIGRNPTDRGRKASKISLLVDDAGVPVALFPSPANVSDQKLVQNTLNSAFLPLQKGLALLADKGYDSAANRAILSREGFRDRISRRRCKVGRRSNAKRVRVEHAFSWQDKFRRLLHRFERKITSYVSLSLLAFGCLLARRTTIAWSAAAASPGRGIEAAILNAMLPAR